VKLAQKRGKDMSKLREVILLLMERSPLLCRVGAWADLLERPKLGQD